MNLAEGVQLVSLGILGVMMIGAAIGVVLFSSIVYSAFMLGGVFISMAGIYLLLNGDFVASAQILIYVGAVNVLILFAIMLVNKRQDFVAFPNSWVRKLLTGLVSVGLFGLLSTMVLATPWAYSTTPVVGGESSIVVIGEHFFTDFLLPFELASILLLIAMVGAIILARREYLPDQLTRIQCGANCFDFTRTPQRTGINNQRNKRVIFATSFADKQPAFSGGILRFMQLQYFLLLAAALFCIGIYGLITSRNAVRVLMSIELLLNAVNLNLMAFSNFLDSTLIKGQVFTVFVITVAAAEAAVGLAIVLAIYRNRDTVDMEQFNLLKW